MNNLSNLTNKISAATFLKTISIVIATFTVANASIVICLHGFDRSVPIIFIVYLLPSLLLYAISLFAPEKLVFWTSNLIFAALLSLIFLDMYRLPFTFYSVYRIVFICALVVAMAFTYRKKSTTMLVYGLAVGLLITSTVAIVATDYLRLNKISAASNTIKSDLAGNWKSVGYLQWGIRDGKVTEVGPMVLSANHFAYFFFDLKQTLTIKVDGENQEKEFEIKDANQSVKVLFLNGSIQSDRPILDSECKKVPFLSHHFACDYKERTSAPLKFMVANLDNSAFDDKRSLVVDRFEKNGINDIKSVVTTSFQDGSSGGTLILFSGKDHLVLPMDYYKNEVSADEYGLPCPKGNTCTSTGLLFERTSDQSK